MKREQLSEVAIEILWDQFCKVIKFQHVNNDIAVRMTFDEYLSLWSKTRVATLERKKAESDKSLNSYLTGPFRPVCSWVSKDARVKGGTMTVDVAQIRTADESRRLFRFHVRDRHTDEARAAIGDSKRGRKQTPEQIAKRTASRVATMAAKRGDA